MLHELCPLLGPLEPALRRVISSLEICLYSPERDDADGGGAAADGGGAAGRQLPRRRGWLAAPSEDERIKLKQSAASVRLLKQLADFNPSGKEDSAPNVLLPNEGDARERGTRWGSAARNCLRGRSTP